MGDSCHESVCGARTQWDAPPRGCICGCGEINKMHCQYTWSCRGADTTPLAAVGQPWCSVTGISFSLSGRRCPLPSPGDPSAALCDGGCCRRPHGGVPRVRVGPVVPGWKCAYMCRWWCRQCSQPSQCSVSLGLGISVFPESLARTTCARIRAVHGDRKVPLEFE